MSTPSVRRLVKQLNGWTASAAQAKSNTRVEDFTFKSALKVALHRDQHKNPKQPTFKISVDLKGTEIATEDVPAQARKGIGRAFMSGASMTAAALAYMPVIRKIIEKNDPDFQRVMAEVFTPPVKRAMRKKRSATSL
ncbi:MAG: hypothetical protein ACOYMG_26490 [Candidatus Methylumidiphilus sp.]